MKVRGRSLRAAGVRLDDASHPIASVTATPEPIVGALALPRPRLVGGQGNFATLTVSSWLDVKLPTTSVPPSGSADISRGKEPAVIVPRMAGRCASAAAALTTVRLD